MARTTRSEAFRARTGTIVHGQRKTRAAQREAWLDDDWDWGDEDDRELPTQVWKLQGTVALPVEIGG